MVEQHLVTWDPQPTGATCTLVSPISEDCVSSFNPSRNSCLEEARAGETGSPTAAFVMVHLEFDTQARRSPELMSLTFQRMTLSVPRYICPSTVKLPHAHPTFLPMLTWILMGTQGVHSIPHCGCDPCERLWVFLNDISHLGKKHGAGGDMFPSLVLPNFQAVPH